MEEVRKIEIDYKPKKWQAEFDANLSRYSTLVVHRQEGKTYYMAYKAISELVLSNKKDFAVAYVNPNLKQAKRNIWKNFKEFASNPVKMIPGSSVNETDLTITINGKTLYILGTENVEAIRGMTIDLMIIDECGDLPVGVWEGILYPTLLATDGQAIFGGTVKGRNDFYKFYMNGASGDIGWYSKNLTLLDTDKPQEKIDEIKRMYTKGYARAEDNPRYRAEMLNDWDAGIIGAYYGKSLDKALSEGRIGLFNYDHTYPVVASFDLGLDGTVVWYAQVIGQNIFVIDYQEFSDREHLDDIMKAVTNKPYSFSYVLMPHDGVKGNIATRDTPHKIMKRFFKEVKTLRRTPRIEDDINGVIRNFDKIYFNRPAVQDGLDHLGQYSAEYDKNTGEQLKKPKKGHTHAADSFRYLILGTLKYEDSYKRRSGTNLLNHLSGNSLLGANPPSTHSKLTDWNIYD